MSGGDQLSLSCSPSRWGRRGSHSHAIFAPEVVDFSAVSTFDFEPSRWGFITHDIMRDAALLEGFRAGEVNPSPCHSAKNYKAFRVGAMGILF
jgi:hypothetical protein